MADQRIVVFDLETVPDLTAARLVLKAPDALRDQELRVLLGQRYAKGDENPSTAFVKTPLHRIVCIGALYAERASSTEAWEVSRSGVGHIGVRNEAQLVEGFIESLSGSPSPQLIGFNSSSFDLPLLRYRAMALSIGAPLLHKANGKDYWYRFGRDHMDLCDVISGFGASQRPSLIEIAALCGVPAKIGDIDGSNVEALIESGRVEEVAAYCETDIVVTYYVFLRFGLATGELSREQYRRSVENLVSYLSDRVEKRPHLAPFIAPFSSALTQLDGN